jgi:hypothetical protein
MTSVPNMPGIFSVLGPSARSLSGHMTRDLLRVCLKHSTLFVNEHLVRFRIDRNVNTKGFRHESRHGSNTLDFQVEGRRTLQASISHVFRIEVSTIVSLPRPNGAWRESPISWRACSSRRGNRTFPTPSTSSPPMYLTESISSNPAKEPGALMRVRLSYTLRISLRRLFWTGLPGAGTGEPEALGFGRQGLWS